MSPKSHDACGAHGTAYSAHQAHAVDTQSSAASLDIDDGGPEADDAQAMRLPVDDGDNNGQSSGH